MSGHDSGISLKDLLRKAVGDNFGPTVMGLFEGATQYLPDCYGCTKRAIPLRCTRCGQFACMDHAYVNVGRLSLVCVQCQTDLLGEDIGGGVDPHEVLGVKPGATRAQVERAFRIKSKSCHPDHHPDDEKKKKEWAQLQWARESILFSEE